MLRLTHTEDLRGTEWIAPELGAWASVGGVVPSRFARVVAVPNDPELGYDSQVAAARREAFDRTPTSRLEPDPHEDASGTLPAERWRDLAGVIASVHGDQPITVGLWIGYGSIAAPGELSVSIATFRWYRLPGPLRLLAPAFGALMRLRERLPKSARRRRQEYRDAVARGAVTDFGVDVREDPLLELPGREYALFRGTTAVLRDPDWRRASGWAWDWNETFDLAWADDRSWYAASDTDTCQVYLGCSDDLAEAVLAGGLGAREVAPSDPLI